MIIDRAIITHQYYTGEAIKNVIGKGNPWIHLIPAAAECGG